MCEYAIVDQSHNGGATDVILHSYRHLSFELRSVILYVQWTSLALPRYVDRLCKATESI